MKKLLLLVMILAAACWPVLAQQGNTAGIFGTVTDQADAVVSGATVTAINTGTSLSRTTKTNANGQYTLSLLPAGPFTVVVEQAGFSRFERTGLRLEVNDNAKVDVQLRIGSTDESIQVSGDDPMVQTAAPLLKEVIDSRRVVDLPLNGRVLADLAILSPGVVPANGATSTGSYDQGNGFKAALNTRELSINGAQPNQIFYTLDGAMNIDIMYNVGLPFPFPDATQEFSVQTAGQGIDVGHSVGGSINVVTKSGTNSIHGDAFWFVRNTEFNAENYFSKTPDNLKRNQGGFTLGAPILKNKLFVFGGWEQTWIRQTNGASSSTTMPLLHRSGDFSDVKTTIYQPGTKTPYPGNIIPAVQLSPAMLNLLAWEPTPNTGTKFYYPTRTVTDINQEVFRTDYQLNSHNLFYGRFYRQYGNNDYPALGKNLFSAKNGGIMTDTSGTVAWTATISPKLTVDTHYSGYYGPASRTLHCPWGTVASLGVQINPLACEISISMTGTNTVSLGSSSRGAPFNRANLSFSNAWRYQAGSHGLVFGADLNWNQYNMHNPYHGSGVFAFSGVCTGNSQADAMIGCLSTFLQGNGTLEFRRQHYRGLYAGDSFRLAQHLTLTAGLRWEPFGFVYDTVNRNVQFQQQLYNSGFVSSVYHNSPAGFAYPGDTVNGKRLGPDATSLSKIHFAPRLGLAWDVLGNGKMSVRAGYGLFYSTPETYILNGMTNQAPFGYDQMLTEQKAGTFDQPYMGRESSNIFPLPSGFLSNPNLAWTPPGIMYALQPEFKAASTSSWNLSVERQFGQSYLLRVAYVGSRTNHLNGTYDVNLPVYNTALTLQQNQATEDTTRRPMKGETNLFVLCTCLPSDYNAVQVSFNKRFSRGLTLLTNYSFSRANDYISDGLDIQTLSGGGTPQNTDLWDPTQPRRYRGPSDWNMPHRFVESAVYQLPRITQSGAMRPLAILANGWTISGNFILQSGRPYSITTSADVLAGAGQATAVQTGPLTLSGRSHAQQAAKYFNTANVSAAPANSHGNMGRNVLQGPNFLNLDTAVYRKVDLPWRDSMKLMFRLEAFNATNHVNLSNPNGSVGSSSFGQISSTASDPRILQLAMKLLF
jgi:hypothetical protein